MPLVIPTYQELMQSFANELAENPDAVVTDLNQGSKFGMGYVRPILARLARLYEELRVAERDSNPATATGDSLELMSNFFGLQRSGGEFARGGILAIPRTPGDTILLPAGTAFAVEEGTLATTALYGAADPYSVMQVVAGVRGEQMNLAAGRELTPLTQSLAARFQFIVGEGYDASGKPFGGLVGGAKEETDDALRIRLITHMASLSKGIYLAIYSGMLRIPGLRSFIITEHSPMVGFITITVDDGTNNTLVSPTMVGLIDAMLRDTKAHGIARRLYALDKVRAAVEVRVKVSPAMVPATVKAAVEAYLLEQLSEFPQGFTLEPSKLNDLAFDVDGVLAVEVVSPTAPVVVGSQQVFRPSSVVASVVL